MADVRLRLRQGMPIAFASLVLALALMMSHWQERAVKDPYGGSYTRRGGDEERPVVFDAASPWRSLFREAELAISCGAAMPRVRVFVADSEMKLEEKVARNRWTWCGLYRRNGTCRVGVEPTKEIRVLLKKLRAKDECRVELKWRFSTKLFAAFCVGVTFLLFASLLSQSKPFRLGAGATTVALASAVLLLYLIHSRVPRGRIAASVALFGTSISGLCRWFYGAWIPQYDEDVIWKAIAVYLVVGFLAGLAVTHVVDDERNHKAREVLRAALKILGGILIGFGMRPWWMAACAFALVVAQKAYTWKFNRYLAEAPNRDAPAFDQAVVPVEPADEQKEPHTPNQLREEVAEESLSPLVQRGLIVNMDTLRNIRIGGNTYNKLLAQGYTPDMKAGMISPPDQSSRAQRARRRSSLASHNSE
eukprot:scaffold1235_cov300-Pavlova_lutheri.AAC.8